MSACCAARWNLLTTCILGSPNISSTSASSRLMSARRWGGAGADDEGEAALVLVHLVEDVVDGRAVDVVLVRGVAEDLLTGTELGAC